MVCLLHYSDNNRYLFVVIFYYLLLFHSLRQVNSVKGLRARDIDNSSVVRSCSVKLHHTLCTCNQIIEGFIQCTDDMPGRTAINALLNFK